MNKYLDYTEKEEIHIFRWKSANRRAVDAWLKWMTHIMIRDGKLGYVLIDFSEIGLPPVRHLAMQVRRWLTQYAPTNPGAKVAVVYPASNMPFLIVARSYTVTLSRGRPVKLEFFSSDEMDSAYKWLSNNNNIEDNATKS